MMLPQVAEVCQADVHVFFVDRAADVRRDLPLLAACAADSMTVGGVLGLGWGGGEGPGSRPIELSCRAAIPGLSSWWGHR